MYTKTIQILFSLVFLSSLVVAQEMSLIKGRIIDDNNEPLIGATVEVTNTGTTTDIEGNYRLSLSAGDYDLIISYIGYQKIERSISLTEKQELVLDFQLVPSPTLLETATITSGKFEKPLGEVTVSLEILQPKLIQNTGKTEISSALEKIPGVNIIDGQANIRGGSGYSQGAGSRVLLLMDDIPILDASSGFPNWRDVPIENIGQVEVLKGASSALYGSSAMNGIINVRTAYAKSEPETEAAVFTNITMNPPVEAYKWWDSAPLEFGTSLSHKRKIGKLDLVAGGYYLNSESHNKDWTREYGRFNINTRYRANDRLTFGVNSNFNTGVNETFFYWADVDTAAYIQAPNTRNRSEPTRYNIDPYLSYYDNAGNRHKLLGRYYRIDNQLEDNRSNSSYQYYAEYQFQREFTNLDLILTAGGVVSGSFTRAELYGDTSFTSRNLAAYAQLDKKFFDKLNISAGFRFEDNLLDNPGFVYDQGIVEPSKDRESKPVFRIGANYQVAKATYLRASWGQGYRYPTIAEKYITTVVGGFAVLPNPDLQSETGWSAELGLKQGFKIAKFQGYLDVAGFTMRYFDMMEYNFLGNGFQSTNIGGTRISGLDATVAGTGNIGKVNLGILAGYTYVNPRFLDFDTTPPKAGEDLTIGQINVNNSSSSEDILKYRSQHVAKIDVQATYGKFSLGVASFYNSRIEAIDLLFNFVIPGLLKFREADNGYNFYNLRAAYQVNKNVKTSLILNNAFNELYSVRPGLMEAPRNLTVRLDFSW